MNQNTFFVSDFDPFFHRKCLQILKVRGPHLRPVIAGSFCPIFTWIGFKLKDCLGLSTKFVSFPDTNWDRCKPPKFTFIHLQTTHFLPVIYYDVQNILQQI